MLKLAGSQASPIRPDKHFAQPRESHLCREHLRGMTLKGPTHGELYEPEKTKNLARLSLRFRCVAFNDR